MKQLIFSLLTISLLATACNNEKKKVEGDKKDNSTMSTENKQERNKKAVMESMEAFNNNDMDGVFKNTGTSFVDYTDGTIPPITNIDSIKTFFKAMKAAIPDYKGSNLIYLADGDWVAVIGEWSGTFKNDLMGMKATGKTFKFKDTDLFKLSEDGKIIEHSSVANFGAALMAAK